MMLDRRPGRVSTRLRPRSLAALQAVSAAASDMRELLGGRLQGRDADADRHRHARAGLQHGQLLGALAQRLGEALGVAAAAEAMSTKRSPEMRAPKRPGRQALAHQLAELPEQGIADVHAGVLVDGVQLVDVDVQTLQAWVGLRSAITVRTRCSNSGRVYRPLKAS